MDFEAYRKAYFIDPSPEQRYRFAGINGVTVYFEAYEEAVQFYSRVLGPPAYSEGRWTRGWQIGGDWLTLLKGEQGGPTNTEVSILMDSAVDVLAMYNAFISAGATGQPPTDQLMYEPLRFAMVTDPFGTILLIFSRIEEA